MEQTKLESAIESTVNVGSGYIISYFLLTLVVAPIWDFEVTVKDSLHITALFTIISVVRGFLWRRFFNGGLHKKIHIFVGFLYGITNTK